MCYLIEHNVHMSVWFTSGSEGVQVQEVTVL